MTASQSAADTGSRFTTDQLRTLSSAAAILIPPDERSKGGTAPGVAEYIDFVVANGSKDLIEEWRYGLGILQRSTNLEARLRQLARNEFRPRTREERFFVLLKSAVVDAFYTSEEGITKELGYQGLGHVMEFPDFTGVKTQVPKDHKPMLRARS